MMIMMTTIIHYGHKILSHAKPGVKSRNLGATELLQPVEPPLLLCLLVFEQKMMVMMIMQNKNKKKLKFCTFGGFQTKN